MNICILIEDQNLNTHGWFLYVANPKNFCLGNLQNSERATEVVQIESGENLKLIGCGFTYLLENIFRAKNVN